MDEITIKPYETAKHLAIDVQLSEIHDYIDSTLKEDNRIARLDGGVLALALSEITAYYESLSEWLAHQRFKINDLKTAYDLGLAGCYVRYKNAGETDSTAKMLAKIDVGDQEDIINKEKHLFDVVEAVKKTLGRYHDSVRSQLSYEKQQEAFNRH